MPSNLVNCKDRLITRENAQMGYISNTFCVFCRSRTESRPSLFHYFCRRGSVFLLLYVSKLIKSVALSIKNKNNKINQTMFISSVLPLNGCGSRSC